MNSETGRPERRDRGSWELILPALEAVLIAVFGELTEGISSYFDTDNRNARHEFVVIDDGGVDVYALLRKPKAEMRLGVFDGGICFGLHAGDIGAAEVWQRLGAAGLLPPEDPARSFDVGKAAPSRRDDAVLFASLGLLAITHVEALVHAAGFGRVRWCAARPERPPTWTVTEAEADLARAFGALGLALWREGDVAVVCIPPADVPIRLGPQSKSALRDRRCPDPGHWRNRFAPSYVPARFTSGPRDAEGVLLDRPGEASA